MSLVHAYNQTVADGTATSVVRPSDWNSAHVMNMTLTGNTLGASTISGSNIVYEGGANVQVSGIQGANVGTIVFANSAGLTTAALSNHSHGNPTLALTNLSGTTASASNGLTISLSAGAGGGGGGSGISFWEPYQFGNNTVVSSFGHNTIYIQPLIPTASVFMSAAEFQASISWVSSSNTQRVNQTIEYGLYGHDTNGNLTQIATSNFIIMASYSSNASCGLTFSQGAASYTTSSAGTNLMSQFSGAKYMYFPFTTTLNQGDEYFWAMKVSTASSVNTGPMRMSFMMMTNHTQTGWGKLKVGSMYSSHTSYKEEFDGWARTATSSNLAGTLTKSEMSVIASKARMYILFENEA